MRTGRSGKFLIFAFAIAAGSYVLAFSGDRHSDRVDVVKSLSVSPVHVSRLEAHDVRS